MSNTKFKIGDILVKRNTTDEYVVAGCEGREDDLGGYLPGQDTYLVPLRKDRGLKNFILYTENSQVPSDWILTGSLNVYAHNLPDDPIDAGYLAYRPKGRVFAFQPEDSFVYAVGARQRSYILIRDGYLTFNEDGRCQGIEKEIFESIYERAPAQSEQTKFPSIGDFVFSEVGGYRGVVSTCSPAQVTIVTTNQSPNKALIVSLKSFFELWEYENDRT